MGNIYTKDEDLHEIVARSITTASCDDISTYSKQTNCKNLTSFVRNLLIENFNENYLIGLYIKSHQLNTQEYSVEEASFKLSQFYLNIFFLYCLIKSSIQLYTMQPNQDNNNKILKLLIVLDKLFEKNEIKINPLFNKNHLFICILETYSIIK